MLSIHQNQQALSKSDDDFRNNLIAWYQGSKRNLPWRCDDLKSANPFSVMVSEFMLQQTTVQTVIPYFYRFMDRFNTIESLASASLDEVYTYWQGLGYYSRAKNLWLASKKIVEMGAFPTNPIDLKALPGIGAYTSAAIASIAFKKPYVPVDGNVVRVITRLLALKTPKGPALIKEVQQWADFHFLGEGSCDDVAQGLMELGATICRFKNPNCGQCPFQKSCKAFQQNAVHDYPKYAPKPIKPKYSSETFVITNDHQEILWIKRPHQGLFAHLYILPTTYFGFIPPTDGVINISHTLLKPIQHSFTHFDLTLNVTVGTCFTKDTLQFTQGEWISKKDQQNIAIPTLMRKVLKAAGL